MALLAGLQASRVLARPTTSPTPARACDERSGHVTGQTIGVNGGRVAT